EATEAGTPPPPMPPEAVKVPPFVPPRLYVSDAAVEKIAPLIQAGPAGMVVIRDELAGLFSNMSRYSNGSDREFWLEAWNGKSHVVERMGRDPVVVHLLLVSFVVGLQPDKWVRSFEGDADGMYARMAFPGPEDPAYKPL